MLCIKICIYDYINMYIYIQIGPKDSNSAEKEANKELGQYGYNWGRTLHTAGDAEDQVREVVDPLVELRQGEDFGRHGGRTVGRENLGESVAIPSDRCGAGSWHNSNFEGEGKLGSNSLRGNISLIPNIPNNRIWGSFKPLCLTWCHFKFGVGPKKENIPVCRLRGKNRDGVKNLRPNCFGNAGADNDDCWLAWP